MRGAVPPLPQYALVAWRLIKKHWDIFTIAFTFLKYLYVLQYYYCQLQFNRLVK
jgi:hypothetical protein